jgi:hypothetical protein
VLLLLSPNVCMRRFNDIQEVRQVHVRHVCLVYYLCNLCRQGKPTMHVVARRIVFRIRLQ